MGMNINKNSDSGQNHPAEFEESGRGLELEAKGEAKKAHEVAQNLLHDGFFPEQTAKLCGLDIEKVRALAIT